MAYTEGKDFVIRYRDVRLSRKSLERKEGDLYCVVEGRCSKKDLENAKMHRMRVVVARVSASVSD
jgi:hypothetical protein